MIRKYVNELAIAGALLFALAGYLYQHNSQAWLEASLTRMATASRQITETKTLKKVWSTQGLKKKVSALRDTLPTAKVQTFALGKQKLSARFVKLAPRELNKVATQIASLPVRIETLKIDRSGDTYTMECQCRW